MRVAAGILSRAGRFLVCQRRGDGLFPRKWEFPGGKIEAGEGARAALDRELREELNVTVEETREIFRHTYEYAGGLRVELVFFEVLSYGGIPRNQVFERIDWVPAEALGTLDFLEGDQPLVRVLSDGGLKRLPERREEPG